MEKKLFLLDAMALIYRAYFALNKNPRITSKGINTSAFLGFANTLLELLKKERPTHLGVAFDTMAPTARHLEFTQYKANREKMPEDIEVCIPYIKRFLKAMNIPVLYAEGYEADDVVGTLSKKAEQAGYTVYMVTPDKDFGQLVSPNIFMYKPARMGNGIEILGPEEVCAKFGVSHQLQVIDMLGLWGDASDNIPGIPGVGEVTARKLIAQFGSVENMIEHADQIENVRLREKVKTYAGQALESKMLATILLDAPVDFDENSLRISAPDKDSLSELFQELEMRSLASRIFAYYASVDSQLLAQSEPVVSRQDNQEENFQGLPEEKKNQVSPMPDLFSPQNGFEELPFICGEDFMKEVTVLPDEDALERFLKEQSLTSGDIAFCLIPLNENQVRHTPVCAMAFALESELCASGFPEGGSEKVLCYIPESFRKQNNGTDFNEREKDLLFNFFGSEKLYSRLACYDLKNQLHFLRNQGFEGELKAFDILLAHYLIEPESNHDLVRLVQNYLSHDMRERKRGRSLLYEEDITEDLLSAVQCVKAVIRLRPCFGKELERVSMTGLLQEVEIPLSDVLCRMEREGVCIDTVRLAEYSSELKRQISLVEEKIYSYAGQRFNIASPRQLGEILYEKLRITDKPKKTKSKQYSTAEDVLVKLRQKHPIVEEVLHYRSLTKLLSTYVDSLPLMIDSQTGRIHTTYNQAVTATGRLSSQNPNLQNIPIRSDLGREIRRCFVPSSPGHYLLSADYSQIELRIIAHLSGDAAMLADFSGHKDVHTATAANVFNVKPEEVDSDMRRKAKMVNFGIIYGISAFGLAERLQISRKEASELIGKYFEHYSGLKGYIEKVVAEAREKGYVETILHRRRYLKDITSANAVVRAYAERNAVNAPVQGSSADMIKVAMIEVDREIRKRGLGARMLMQVHDELVLDVPAQEAEEVSRMVVDIMKNGIRLKVPLEVEARCASNWLDAH